MVKLGKKFGIWSNNLFFVVRSLFHAASSGACVLYLKLKSPVSGPLNTERRQIMKRIAYQFTYPTSLVIAAVVFLVTIAFASANLSQAVSATPPQKTSAKAKVSKVDRTEARIKDLRARLKITPAQEDLWNKLTQVMRDDAKTMDALNQARYEKIETMTAIEDLKSYSEIAQAHADELKNFIPVFEALYASMSDDQKKDADTLFRHGTHKKSMKKGK
jgi:protein CpxP